jgi:Zn-dependent protease
MSFRLFGYDVEITASFWFSAVLLGFLMSGERLMLIVPFVLVMLISVLGHELGHAVAFSRYGVRSAIRLHFLGGVTMPSAVLPLGRRALVVISFAGPFAGLLLAGLTFLFFPKVCMAALWGLFPGFCAATGVCAPPIPQLIEVSHTGFLQTIALFFVANVFWSLFNLAPVLPLDGGHILEHALGPKRYRTTLLVSGISGAALAIYFGLGGSMIATFIFGSSALQAFMRLRDVQGAVRASSDAMRERRANGQEEVHPEVLRDLKLARRALDEERFDEASRLAFAVADGQTSSGIKPSGAALGEALTIAGWAELGAGRTERAIEACDRMVKSKAPGDAALFATVALERGEAQKARSLLEAARAAGDNRKEVFGPLIRILLEQGEAARAAAVALDCFDGLNADDARTIAEQAAQTGADTWAGRLFEAVFERERTAEDGFESARAFARSGDPERALSLLRSAVGAGFDDSRRAYGDEALGKLALDNILPRPS